jgi:hypothetical protein
MKPTLLILSLLTLLSCSKNEYTEPPTYPVVTIEIDSVLVVQKNGQTYDKFRISVMEKFNGQWFDHHKPILTWHNGSTSYSFEQVKDTMGIKIKPEYCGDDVQALRIVVNGKVIKKTGHLQYSIINI